MSKDNLFFSSFIQFSTPERFNKKITLLLLSKFWGFHAQSTQVCSDAVKVADFTSFKALQFSGEICTIVGSDYGQNKM